MKMLSCSLITALVLLLTACDSYYRVIIINKTTSALQVKIHYDVPDGYWRSSLDTINAQILNSNRSDTIVMIVRPEGYIYTGINSGISDFYDAESIYCDYLEIAYDSTSYSATSKKGVLHLLHNLKKSERKGELEVIE